MDEDRFNQDMRKFLKTFGVTSQREIEHAVAAALEDGRLHGNETLRVRAVLSIDGLLQEHTVNGAIALE